MGLFFCLHAFQKPWERQNWRQFYLTGVKLLEVGCFVLLSEVLIVSYYDSKIGRKMVWHIWSYPRASLGSAVSEERQFSFFISRYFVLFFSNFRVSRMTCKSHRTVTKVGPRDWFVVYAGRPSKLLFTLNHVVVVHNHSRASQQYFLLNRSHLDNAQLTQLLTNFVDMIRMVLF